MSGWATGWVMKNVKGIPAARKLVLLVLADEANDDGCHCFPSVRRIADHADIGVGTARNHLNELEAAGLIVIDRPEKQGRGHFNRYGIVMDRTVEEVQADLDEERGRKPTPSRGEKGVRKGSERGQKGVDNARAMGRANPDPDPDPEKDSYPKEFEELWKARAQRVGSDSKKAAHRAWKARVREGTDPAHLQAAVEQYARSRVGEDPKFTKMLSTYLGPDEHWRADWEIVAMNQAMAGEISGSAYTHRAVMVDCPQCGGHGWTLEAIDRGGLDPEHDRCGTCKGRGKVVAEAVGEAF